MNEQKVYPERDPTEFVDYYMRHVEAMTSEELFGNGDIAVQLAWRDYELDQLRQRLAEAEAQLAECFRLGGTDNDGNGEAWQAQRAVESVRNLRKDYDDACEEMYGEGGLNKRADAAEAKLALAEADNARLNRLLHASADSSHKCKRCGLPYTPLDGASEDCPDCGYDGIPAIDGSGESLPPHKEGGD